MLINDEIFLQTIDKLIAQGGCSVGENGECLYNGEGGRHCFAGHLVPDKLKPLMREGSVDRMLDSVEMKYEQSELDLAHHGQGVHDNIADNVRRLHGNELPLLNKWRQLVMTHGPMKVRFIEGTGEFIIDPSHYTSF